MKLSTILGVAAAAGMLGFAGAAAAGSCVATCNSSNQACMAAGKPQATCLNAWHQCKVGCSASAAPPKMTVSQPAPGTVVIKTAPAKPAKH